MMPKAVSAGYTICIARRRGVAYSETFIEAHIQHLPAHIIVLTEREKHYPGARLLPLPFSRLYHLLCRYIERLNAHPSLNNRLQARLLPALFLTPWLKFRRVDIMMAEYGPTGVHVLDACRWANIPLITHFHGFDAYLHETLKRYIDDYQRMFAYAHRLIAVSRDMQRQLMRLGAPSHKIVYNPYGIDTALFADARPASEPPTFVAVGRFVEKKAPYLTLLAFRRVVDVYPTARLLMIGDGPLRDVCCHLARALHIDEQVEFRGAQSHADVSDALQRARAYVLHSLRASSGDSEGTPVAVLEAGAAGVPVVSTRHAGIADVVIHGSTGLLVDEGDVEGMAAHMITLAQDPVLATRLGQQARAHVAANFTMQSHIHRLWQVIKQGIEQPLLCQSEK